MPKKGYRQTPEHRAKIAAMRSRPGALERTRKTNQRHGMTGTPTYLSWSAMKQRCAPSGKYYKLGVTVCERWATSFENFYADMGERPDGLTLDRIDVFGNYEPNNCRWATAEQQAANTRRAAVGRNLPTAVDPEGP